MYANFSIDFYTNYELTTLEYCKELTDQHSIRYNPIENNLMCMYIFKKSPNSVM